MQFLFCGRITSQFIRQDHLTCDEVRHRTENIGRCVFLGACQPINVLLRLVEANEVLESGLLKCSSTAPDCSLCLTPVDKLGAEKYSGTPKHEH